MFSFAPCALRFANSPGPVKHPQRPFIIYYGEKVENISILR
jgi:hypothetical protein